MERYEFPVRGETQLWVEAAERGDEVVLTRDGKAVATIQAAHPAEAGSLDPLALDRLRTSLQELRMSDGAALIRELRDASDH